MFGAVGRWVTSQGRGPAHLEWIHDGQTLWLLQIDFEHEQPDDGVDPNAWLREADHLPTGSLSVGSPLHAVDLDPAAAAGPWRKVENVRRFAAVRQEAYPQLATITGDRLVEAVARDRQALESDLEAFAQGRVVCRTDCRTEGIGRENLPRSNTVSSTSAVDHMMRFLTQMDEAGASAHDVCFLVHKFIPARSGAWARADPASPIVRVDSLWGVPDGLQYLAHDTFDVDVRRKAISAERLRYKPRFIQECPDGTWRELKVRRVLARTASLSASDAIAVSIASHAVATRAGRPLLVMWFCGIPPALGIGTNLPWFSMPPNPVPALVGEAISPRWPRLVLRTLADVAAALTTGAAKNVLLLDPEVALFRDGEFLSEVIRLAKRDHCPVQLAGSTLAHAHYQLEKAGVAVVPADGPARSRARGRRSFAKLVRDELPAQIAGRGELVLQSRLPRSEMRRALVAKLMEEAQELLAATDPDDVKTELADLLEVVRAMAGITGVDWTEVEATASEKRERRGGFGAGAVLVGTEWPATDRKVQRAPPMVSLRGLGRVTNSGRSGTASFNALLATSDGLEVQVGTRRITVRLTREGIVLDAGSNAPGPPAQLVLPLGDDTAAGRDDH
jgi:predicted house-cleaning noncanonical NTP pyrophosphatase (MazG superfamily)